MSRQHDYVRYCLARATKVMGTRSADAAEQRVGANDARNRLTCGLILHISESPIRVELGGLAADRRFGKCGRTPMFVALASSRVDFGEAGSAGE